MHHVLVNGCFDGLHRGHVRLLHFAQNLGRVYVGLNTDESVRRLKGADKPRLSWEKRAEAMREFTRDVFPVDVESDILDLIQVHRVDYIVKGVDTLTGKYLGITGRELVKAVIYVDHKLPDLHSSRGDT